MVSLVEEKVASLVWEKKLSLESENVVALMLKMELEVG